MLVPYKLLYGWPTQRTLFTAFSYSQDQYVTFKDCRYLLPPTGEAIQSYCKTAGIADTVVELTCDADTPPATLHFINCEPEDQGNVLLYFHGGGFGNPIIGPGHVPFALESAQAASISKVIMLEYSLAPDSKYPTQLIQAISATRYLLQNHSPSQIVIGGDSAGGNMSLAVLSHIIEPSPYTAPLALNGAKLRGALLISPWVTFSTAAPSFEANAKADFLCKRILDEFADALEPKMDEVYSEPVVAKPEFWKNMPVAKILITAGDWEVFLDDIQSLAKNMNAKEPRENATIELAISKRECHIQSVIDLSINISPPGMMMQQVLDWCKRL